MPYKVSVNTTEPQQGHVITINEHSIAGSSTQSESSFW